MAGKTEKWPVITGHQPLFAALTDWHRNILQHWLFCAHSSNLYYIEWILTDNNNILRRGPQYLCFSKNYSLAEVTYLLIGFNKTKSFQWNTKKTDRNHINEQNTRTPHTERKMRSPSFRKILFYQYLPLYGKNQNPLPWENFENSNPQPRFNYERKYKFD